MLLFVSTLVLGALMCHRHASLSSEISYNETSATRSTNKTAAVRAKIRYFFWLGLSKGGFQFRFFFILIAIIGDDEQVECDPTPAILHSLAKYWSLFFDGRNSSFDESCAACVLENDSRDSRDFSNCRLLSSMIFVALSCPAKIMLLALMGFHIRLERLQICMRVCILSS